MNELEKLEKRKKRTRHILITVSVLFLFLMLVLPLLCIIASSLKRRICLLHAVHPDRLCKECFKGNSDCNSGSGGD